MEPGRPWRTGMMDLGWALGLATWDVDVDGDCTVR